MEKRFYGLVRLGRAMADPLSDPVPIVVAIVVVAIIVLAFLEVKFLRKSMRARRVRVARRVEELPDDAHNALITTKAIAATLERGGVKSEEVASILREAQMAYDRQNYRVVLDLTSRAKEKLTTLKARHAAHGDLAKLESMPASAGPHQATTKELLQKEFPTNLAQSKFSIDMAASSVDRARGAGKDVSRAQDLLAQARSHFEANDYTEALGLARQAQRSADGFADSAVESEVTATRDEPSPACPACGAPRHPDDSSCLECGRRYGT